MDSFDQVPRDVGLGRAISSSPANVQIGWCVAPLIIVGGIVWYFINKSPQGIGAAGLGVVTFLVLLYFTMEVRKKLVHYPMIKGEIVGFTRPEKSALSHLCIVCYEYIVDDRKYEGTHMIPKQGDLQIGDEISILVNPVKPADSMMWVES